MVQRIWYALFFRNGEPRILHVILQVCSVEAAKQLVEKLPANDKKISLYDVRLLF
jgi:hypothetical protein